jgi:hypothetical protein
MTPETTAQIKAAFHDAMDRPDAEAFDALLDGLRARGLVVVEKRTMQAVYGLADCIRDQVEPQVYPPRSRAVEVA